MLRALVAALLLANLSFFAWTHGWLEGVGVAGPRNDREVGAARPQVRPDSLRIVTVEAARAAAAASAAASATAAASALSCLQAGPFGAAETASVVAALKSLTPPIAETLWTDVSTERPGRWAVYMGRYANAEALARKEDELRRRHLDFEEVKAGLLAPGLSLGRYDARQKADDALGALGQQGIHTARVVLELAPVPLHTLRVDRADKALAARLSALKGEPFGPGFTACARPAAG